MDIAKKLKESREFVGKSQTQVSKDTGINNKTLSGYERGVSEPDLNTLKILATYYSVSLDYLLGVSNNNSTSKEIPEEFSSPEAAMKFILNDNTIMGFGGFDVNKMSDDEVVEFANELLNQLKILSYKYKK